MVAELLCQVNKFACVVSEATKSECSKFICSFLFYSPSASVGWRATSKTDTITLAVHNITIFLSYRFFCASAADNCRYALFNVKVHFISTGCVYIY